MYWILVSYVLCISVGFSQFFSISVFHKTTQVTPAPAWRPGSVPLRVTRVTRVDRVVRVELECGVRVTEPAWLTGDGCRGRAWGGGVILRKVWWRKFTRWWKINGCCAWTKPPLETGRESRLTRIVGKIACWTWHGDCYNLLSSLRLTRWISRRDISIYLLEYFFLFRWQRYV